MLETQPAERGTGLSRTQVCLWLGAAFVVLTAAVFLGSGLFGLDRLIFRHTPNAHAHSRLLTLTADLVRVATPGYDGTLTLLAAVIWTLRTGDPEPLARTARNLALLVGVVVGGKALFLRTGPGGINPHSILGSYPSGHTTTALVCLGTMAGLVASRVPRLTGIVWTAAVLWTSLVAAALVYHRDHWFSDILAGAILGTLILVSAGHPGGRYPVPQHQGAVET